MVSLKLGRLIRDSRLCSQKMSKSQTRNQYGCMALFQKVVATVVETASRSTAHGFSKLFSDSVHWIARVIWLLFIMSSWGYMIYQVTNSMMLFFKKNVVSSTSILYEAPTDFFAVDICNLNPLRPEFDFNLYDIISGQSEFNINSSDSLVSHIDNIDAYIQVYLELIPFFPDYTVYQVGLSLPEMLLTCEYNGEKCTADDFYFYQDFYYGNCYRFNGGPQAKSQTRHSLNYKSRPTMKAYQPGRRHGLRLELYSPTGSVDVPYTYKNGFRITIHNQSGDVYPDEDGFDVPLGFETNIGVSRTFIDRLSYPYSNCIRTMTRERARENSILGIIYQKIQSDEIQSYQMQFCLKTCFQLYLLNRCNCSAATLMYLNVSQLESVCFFPDQLNCLSSATTYYYRSDEIRRCYLSCPIECKVSKYKTKISLSNFPTKWYARKLDEYKSFFNLTKVFNSSNITYELMKNSTAFVNIFYESMDYTLISTEPTFTFELLLANIGGNLGLFTGMSVLSFVEVLEATVSVSALVILFLRKKRASSYANSNSDTDKKIVLEIPNVSRAVQSQEMAKNLASMINEKDAKIEALARRVLALEYGLAIKHSKKRRHSNQ